MAPGKRKRTDRGSVDSGDNRPSPHRPGNTALGQHERDSEMRNGERGGRGRGRGGRGGNRGRGFDRRDSSDSLNHAAAPPRTPSAMSAPPTRPDPPKQTPSQSTPSAQSPAPVEATPAPRPRKEPSPYDYCHITDARVSSWSTEGRQAVVAAGVQAIDDQDTLDLSSTFQELIRAALDRRLDARDAGECARDILSAAAAQSSDTVDGSALFLDSVSIIADVEEYDPALRELLVATGISPELMRLTLDAPLLQNLGLTRNTFIKAGIRQVTNLLYRQANHNLLREETEGYAKLMTELYTTSGSEPPTSEVVENAFERVKGLIGTFDLDVGRVLDVTMDVFAAVLVKQFRFFVKFLRISSWWPRELNLHGITVAGSIDRGLPKWALPGYGGWTTLPEDEEATARYQEERVKVFWERVREIGFDAFYELGGRRAVGKDTKTIEVGENGDTEAAVDGDLQWIQATGTLPPTGNRTAAQLLGFKLRFYASEARSPKEDLPPNLIYLAALLIKIGFISLRDLYPHLWPLDEDMAAVREKRMKELAEKEKQSRPGATMNALMTAGALADDTLPSSGRVRETAPSKADVSSGTATAAEETPKDKHNEPFDQKVQLLTNLLTVGAIPEALFILGRFPWLPEAFPELYNLIHRILHHSVSKVFEESRPEPSPEEELVPRKMPDDEQASAPKGYVRLTDGTKTIVRRWPYPDRGPEGVEQIAYKFYWDEWADNVPVCQNVDDIFTLCSTFLNLSGVNIGRDAALLRKMYDIGRKSLAEDQSEANLARWQDLLKRVLVPALSFTEANGSLPNQLFDLLRYYPTHVRFSLYAEWYEGQTSRIPAIMTAFTRTRLQTLSTMKRISKTNVTEMARSLAKTAYASPGVVFKVALDQIEAYSNLTEVVVECAKYFTDLGYDVLIWSLLSSLGGQSRSRTRADSVLLTSRWLLALSKFSGKVFRRYSNMDATPILQYVADQLHRGNSTDLIILEELIGQMSGVVSDLDFNDAQLLAMTGGEALRRQTLINLQDKRYESEKTASRLMRALTATRLAGELLVSIAQHRQQAIYAVPEEDAHIKYLSAMIDESQRILVQYLDLLRSNLSVEQFDALVPGIPELMAEYGLETPLAFLLGRGSYARRLDDHVELKTVTNGTKVAVDEDGDTSMKTEEPAPLEASQKSPDDDVEMGGQAAEAAPATPYPPTTDGWQQALEPLVNAVQSVLPAKTWQLVHPQLYVVFWQHSLPDLAMPMESYSAEIRRLSNQISDLIKDRSSTGAARREESRKALEATKDELMKETSERMAKFTNIRARLNHEKKQWFINNNKYDMVNDALLEELFLPRLLLSPTDADYCFKFIKFLHNNGTPNFRTLSLYARLFRANRLRTIIFTCTIREAENLGRFLKHILGDLSKWHAKQDVYEKEALGGSDRKLPGFAKQMGKDEKPVSLVEHDDFRRIVFSFHKQLNTALKSCLSGTEWMHIRNAITVLKSIVEYFPALEFQGKSYLSTLKLIGQREAKTREDLALTANALIPELKRRESKWVMPQAFATNLGELGQPQPATKGRTTPAAEEATSKSALKPTALEFKPQSRSSSKGPSTPSKVPNADVEDGEVDDAKVADTPQSMEKTQSEGTKAEEQAPSAARLSRDDKINGSASTGSRPHTPAPSRFPSHLPEPVRSGGGRGAALEKSNAGLPNRPDVPFPPHVSGSDRHLPARPDDRREPHHGRAERPADAPRDRGRESSNFDRRMPDALPRDPRDLNRPTERGLDAEGDRDRHDSRRRGAEPHRDGRDLRDIRDSRDRPSRDGGRSVDMNGRHPRDEGTHTPRSTAEPAPGAAVPADPPINPARAAQIFGGNDTGRADTQRMGRENHRDRPSSRPHSPRRSERFGPTDRDPADARRGDMGLSRPPPSYAQEYPRGRHDESQRYPGSWNDRPGDRGPPERMRDAPFQPTPTPSKPLDMDHGRLSRPDPNYGRLNDAPPSQIPSGPRDRSSRGPPAPSRGLDGPPPRYESRAAPQEPPRPPTPDRQPPTGPASQRGPPRYEPRAPAPTPSAAAPAPAAGVHPERLRIIDPSAAQAAVSAPAVQAQAPPPAPAVSLDDGIHPSRMPSFQNDPAAQRQAPPAIQTSNIGTASARTDSPNSNGPPSGPRGQQMNSAPNMSPGGFSAPTGPASTNDRRPNRQLAGINSMLQQADQRGPPGRGSERGGHNIRGRGGRMGGPPMYENSSPVSTPTGPNPPPVRDLGPSGPVDRNREPGAPDRPGDLFAGRAMNNAGVETERDRDRGEIRPGGGPRGRDPTSRSEGRRSGGHSRRNSRSPGRDSERERERHRTRDRAPPVENEPPRSDYRDRRPDARERRPGSEREAGRRDFDKGPGRGGPEPRDAFPPSRPPPNGPEWGGMDGPGSGGRSGRDTRSSMDNRGDSRGDGGSGRKRRGDESGMGEPDNRNHDKRPRR